MNNKLERIQKLISQAGVASRRKSEQLIKEGKVKINNKTAQIGQKASFMDKIIVDNLLLHNKAKVYYLLNKPKQCLSAVSDLRGRKVIVSLIKENKNNFIFPVGRLDYDTTGVILITNDGYITNKLLHPSSEILRIYKAKIDKKLTSQELALLNSNKVIIDKKQSIQKVDFIGQNSYLISLHEGKNHHVKKIFKFVKRKVIELNREEFAGITNESLKIGEYRKLTKNEIDYLYSII